MTLQPSSSPVQPLALAWALWAAIGSGCSTGTPFCGAGAAGVGAAGALYVAPDGDDANPGTLARPLRTIAAARDRVRSKTRGMRADFVIYLRGGTYPLTRTLTFTEADGGTGGHYVKYLAYPGERPLISGGRRITGWTLHDATRNLYAAPAGPIAFRQLYVDGVKAIRARTPNLLPGHGANFHRLSGWDRDARTVQVPRTAASPWGNLAKVEMHLMIAWGDSVLRIASLAEAGETATIRFQPEEASLVFVRPNPRMDQAGWGAGRAYYFENAFEMLDQPGEWYLDETTNTVYYQPRPGEDLAKAKVIAPQLETLVSVRGESPARPVGHLWFQGLTFAHSTYLRPSEHGFLNGQAGQYTLTADARNNQTVGRMPAGVRVMNAEHLRFERNLFTQMGATALDFVSGTHDDLIVGNAVTEIAGNGIAIGKFTASETTEYHVPYLPADPREICTRETLRNNYLTRVTTEFQGGVGIAAGYPAHLTVAHNEVSYTNYSGISVGFGWTAAKNAMTHNRINDNDIHHVNQILADGGAIYTLSNQGTGSEIQRNFLHDFACSPWADYGCNSLFLDEQTSGYTVAHNLLVNCPATVTQHRAGKNLIVDNGPHPQGAAEIRAKAGIEPAYADIRTLAVPAF